MEPMVSVPSETVAMLAATNIADPLLDPCGSPDSMYGFCMHEILYYKLFMSNSCGRTFNVSKNVGNKKGRGPGSNPSKNNLLYRN